MSGYIAYHTVLTFIEKEQRAREKKAKQEMWPDDTPITEANEALTALEWLRQAASVTKPNPEPTNHQIALL